MENQNGVHRFFSLRSKSMDSLTQKANDPSVFRMLAVVHRPRPMHALINVRLPAAALGIIQYNGTVTLAEIAVKLSLGGTGIS